MEKKVLQEEHTFSSKKCASDQNTLSKQQNKL